MKLDLIVSVSSFLVLCAVNFCVFSYYLFSCVDMYLVVNETLCAGIVSWGQFVVVSPVCALASMLMCSVLVNSGRVLGLCRLVVHGVDRPIGPRHGCLFQHVGCAGDDLIRQPPGYWVPFVPGHRLRPVRFVHLQLSHLLS